MLEITPLSSPRPNAGQPVRPTGPAPEAAPALTAPTQAEDRVELSVAAESFDRQRVPAETADDRVQQLREQIARETYLTPDKIDYVIERLYTELVRARSGAA